VSDIDKTEQGAAGTGPVRDWVVQVLPEEGHPDDNLDREAKPVFERDDLSDVVSAMNYRKAFYAFVQRRFYEVAASGFEFDAGAIGTVTVNDLPEDEWTDWRVPASFENGYASLSDGFIPIQRVTLDDRGGETFGAVVRFDLDVLFGEREQAEREERYQRYLRLKAEFEPTA
jgi:hypothetical protein